MQSINFKSLKIFEEVKGIAKVSKEHSVFEIVTANSAYKIAFSTPNLTVTDVETYCKICAEEVILVPFIVQVNTNQINSLDTDQFVSTVYSDQVKVASFSWWSRGHIYTVAGRLRVAVRVREGLDIPVDDLVTEATNAVKRFLVNRMFLDEHRARRNGRIVTNSMHVFPANENVSQDILHMSLNHKTVDEYSFSNTHIKDILKSYFKVYDELFPAVETSQPRSHGFWTDK